MHLNPMYSPGIVAATKAAGSAGPAEKTAIAFGHRVDCTEEGLVLSLGRPLEPPLPDPP